MANNPITPTASSYVNGTIIDAQYMDDLASALNREVGFATQATAASTKTLVLADLSTQEFTGTTAAQVVVMPVVTTLGIGMKWVISNKSTQTIAVQSSGANAIVTVPANTNATITCNAITGTTAASWSYSFVGGTLPAFTSNYTAKTAAYTFASGDEFNLFSMNNAATQQFNIPTDATFNFAIGTEFNVFWTTGAGQPTIGAVTPGTTTVVSTGATSATPKLRVALSGATAKKLAANSWIVFGDLA